MRVLDLKNCINTTIWRGLCRRGCRPLFMYREKKKLNLIVKDSKIRGNCTNEGALIEEYKEQK